jgi:hypothetical protein
MKKINILIIASLMLFYLSGCAGSEDDKVYSEEPTDEHAITYLLTEFELKDNRNAESIYYQDYMNQSKAGGYFYTYDDPTVDNDEIVPWAAESDNCTVCVEGETDGKCCTQEQADYNLCEQGEYYGGKPSQCNVAYGIKKKSSNSLKYFGSETSFNLTGSTAGAGVGFGIYFADDVFSDAPKAKEPRALADTGAKGFTFWATGNATVEISLNMPETAPISDGGLCDDEGGEKCFDFHKVTFTLDGAWREYWASWKEFKQEGWGIQVPLDPNKFLNIQIKVVPPEGSGSKDFNIWMDHMGFYGGDVWDHTAFMLDTDIAVDTVPEDSDTVADTAADTGADTATDTGTDTAL